MANEIRTLIFRNFADAMKREVKMGRDELTAQGHRASGKLIDTMEYVVTADGKLQEVTAEILVQDYGITINDGLEAAKVPRSGAAAQKYVSGLIDWARLVKSDLDSSERRQFALNVYAKHKEEGMPTKASFAFSRNGRRTGWIEAAYKDSEGRILEALELETVVVAYIEDVVVTAARP